MPRSATGWAGRWRRCWAQSVQRFQLCYAIGGLAFSFMPGMVADLTGSYAPAYVIFAPFGVFSILTLQSTYRLGSKAPI